MNDSSLETRETVQKAPLRILISEHNLPLNANFVDDAVRRMNKEGEPLVAEPVRVESPQTSLEILQKANEEGNPFDFVVVPGRSKDEKVIGLGLLTAIGAKKIPTRVLVLTSSPNLEIYFNRDDINEKRVIVVDRRDVSQPAQLSALLNTEREEKPSLNRNGR